ncbi:RNA polymerase sigma factor [Actinokineospora enzanensis]|uniref:RNA polymerase sigma factor n=1 Tax=Actinokineospora enzanensis TaxID=155975 RepID=UPI00039BBF9F|nr:RNA polymerase sigma factor [Actinokineospora enzanensis]
MDNGNDRLLVARLRAGDGAAQRELFEQVQPWLRGYFRARADAVDVDDLVSEVITRALEGIRGGAEPAVLGAWVSGIARHVYAKWCEQRKRRVGALPDDLVRPEDEPRFDLDQVDSPEQPAELVGRLSKQQLWDTILAAVHGLSGDMATIMSKHLELTRRRGRWVAGNELAEAVGRPVELVNRQFNRSHARMLDLVSALVIARTGQGDCPALAGMLRPEQRRATDGLVLDADQAKQVLKHAKGCPACAPRARRAKDFSRWALGPGLVGLGEDDDERRRMIAMLFSRAGDAQAGAVALGAVPAPVVVDELGIVQRVRAVLAAKAAAVLRPDGLVRLAQENPDVFQRVVAAAASGVVLAAAIVLAMLSSDQRPVAEPSRDVPPVVSTSAGAVPTSPDGGPGPIVPVAETNPTSPPRSVQVTTSAPTVTTRAAEPRGGQAQSGSEGSTTQPGNAVPTTTMPTTTTLPTTTSLPTTTTSAVTTTTVANQSNPSDDTVTIDITGLSYETFTVSGQTGVLNAHESHRLRLAPGPHTLTVSAGHKVSFGVTADHRITYDPAREGMLTGAGSATLVVHGYAMVLDATDVDYYNITVTGTGWSVFDPTRRRYLLPGKHFVVPPAGKQIPFTMTDSGQVTYDPALRGVLTGEGTSTLAVHGYAVAIDSTGLSYANVTVSGTGWPAYRPVATRRLLPGAYLLLGMNGNSVPFTVTDDGNVTYAASLQGVLSGAGGKTLVAHGLSVTLNSTDLDYYNVTLAGAGWLVRQNVRTYHMLPGNQTVLTAGGQSVLFRLTADGKVQYDGAVAGTLTGAGTETVAVHGEDITVDARATGWRTVVIGGVGVTDARQPQALRLLPGNHSVGSPTGEYSAFQVTAQGTVDYAPALDAVLAGRGTGTLVVRRR